MVERVLGSPEKGPAFLDLGYWTASEFIELERALQRTLSTPDGEDAVQ